MLEPVEALVVEMLHASRRAADPRRGERRRTSSEVMRDVFRQHDLRPRQQKRVKQLFHAVLASESLVAVALERATPGGAVAPQMAPALEVWMTRVIHGDLSPKEAAKRLDWIDWERVANIRAEIGAEPDAGVRLAQLGSIPEWLGAALAEEFGAEADDLVVALCGKAPVTVRANGLKCTREELAERLAKQDIETRPTRWAQHGLEVISAAQLFRTQEFQDGWFELQDEASQLVADVVAPTPGKLVVDACAGAGGKTLALAALLGNKGTVVALDDDAGRLRDLRKRSRRAGVNNARAIQVESDSWSDEVLDLARAANRILVDAPCSGIGSLRRNPDMRARLNKDEIERLRKIQLGLLRRAAPLLQAPKARLIYATCTLLRRENESVIDELLAEFPNLELVSVVEILGGTIGRAVSTPDGRFLRTAPHTHGTDGFFSAVLRVRASDAG